MNETKSYKLKHNKLRNKHVLNMNDKITFNKLNISENNIIQINNIFPEFSTKVIEELLKQHNFNIETTIEDLLSEKYIQENISKSDIKRNNQILEIYNNEVNNKLNQNLINDNNTVVNDLTNDSINIGVDVEDIFPSYEFHKPNENSNNDDIENSNASPFIEYRKRKKNRKYTSNKNIKLNIQEEDVLSLIPGQTYKKTKENCKLLNIYNKSNNNPSSTKSKNKNKKKPNQQKNSQNKSTSPVMESSDFSDDNQSNDSFSNLQDDLKFSELKNIFPNLSDSLINLTYQVYHGNIEKTIDFLLTQNSIIDKINEKDLCNSLKLQLNNEQDLPTSCDGDCINQGYPCILHSHLIQKKAEYNTLNSSEITKIWDQYESHDRNVSIKFTDNNHQSLKCYTQDNDEIEFSILNRIKEAELTMTSEDKKHQDDVEYFRNREAQLKIRVNNLFQKAAKKYKTGGLTGFSSAAYYSQEGNQLKKEKEKAELLAISAQIRVNKKNLIQNNGITNFCGVDLHGLTVLEATLYLKDMLAIWEFEIMKHGSKYSKGRNKSVFNVITGKGLHSNANIGARLRPSITKYLKDNKYNFIEPNPGIIEIHM